MLLQRIPRSYNYGGLRHATYRTVQSGTEEIQLYVSTEFHVCPVLRAVSSYDKYGLKVGAPPTHPQPTHLTEFPNPPLKKHQAWANCKQDENNNKNCSECILISYSIKLLVQSNRSCRMTTIV